VEASNQGVYAALVQAQRAAKAVEKDRKNQHFNYLYASTEQMILECAPHLSEHGLSLYQVSGRLQALDGIKNGDAPQLVWRTRWTLSHADGSSISFEREWPVVPERGRPLDKATAAADTLTLGYLLRDIMLLARVEPGTELDDDSRERNAERDERERAAAGDLEGKLLACQSFADLRGFVAAAKSAGPLSRHKPKLDLLYLSTVRRLSDAALKVLANPNQDHAACAADVRLMLEQLPTQQRDALTAALAQAGATESTVTTEQQSAEAFDAATTQQQIDAAVAQVKASKLPPDALARLRSKAMAAQQRVGQQQCFGAQTQEWHALVKPAIGHFGLAALEDKATALKFPKLDYCNGAQLQDVVAAVRATQEATREKAQD
jgi:hypothetical protein